MKKLFIFCAVMALLACAVIIFGFFAIRNIDPDDLKNFVLDKVNQEINGQLQIESVSLGLHKFGLKNIRLVDKNNDLLMEVPEVKLGLSMLDLIKNFQVKFSVLEINDAILYPALHNDEWNFANLIAEKKLSSEPADTSANKQPTPPRLSMVAEEPSTLTIRSIIVRNARAQIKLPPYPTLNISLDVEGGVEWPEIDINNLQLKANDLISLRAAAKLNPQNKNIHLNMRETMLYVHELATFLKIELPLELDRLSLSGFLDIDDFILKPDLNLKVPNLELKEAGVQLPYFNVILNERGLHAKPVLNTEYGKFDTEIKIQIPMNIHRLQSENWPFQLIANNTALNIQQKKLPGIQLNTSGFFNPENGTWQLSTGEISPSNANGNINFNLSSSVKVEPISIEGQVNARNLDLSSFVNPFSPIPISCTIQELQARIHDFSLQVINLDTSLNSGKIYFSGLINPMAENPMAIIRGRGGIKTLPLNTFAKELEGLILNNLDFNENLQVNAKLTGFGKTNITAAIQPGTSLEKPLANANISGIIDSQQIAAILPDYRSLLPKGLIQLNLNANPEYIITGTLKSDQLLQPVTEGIADIEIKNMNIQVEVDTLALKGKMGQISADLFAGKLTANGSFTAEPMVIRFDGGLKEVDANQLLSHFTPMMKDHTKGYIQLGFNPLILGEPFDRTYPAKADGQLSIRNIHYFYHKTIVEIINIVESSITSKLPLSFLQKATTGLKKNENRPGASFKNVENISYNFDNGQLKLSEVNLQEISNCFQVKLANFKINLPKDEKDTGHIAGQINLLLANWFLQDKFPIKNDFKEDLSIYLTLNGSFEDPIPPAEITRLKKESLDILGKIVDLKKVEQETKEQLKKLEDVAKEKAEGLISGLRDALSSDKPATPAAATASPAKAEPEKNNSSIKEEAEKMKDKLKEEAKKLENSIKSLFKR